MDAKMAAEGIFYLLQVPQQEAMSERFRRKFSS